MSSADLPGLLSPRLRASMSDEPCIKRELESPTPKRQRLSSTAQDMFDLMHQYSPPPATQGSPQGGSHHNHHSHNHHNRRRPNGSYTRWQNDRNNHSGAPRSPASRRSPYPPNHLRRSPHHGLRRSTRHRDRHWHHHHHDREFEVRISPFLKFVCVKIFFFS